MKRWTVLFATGLLTIGATACTNRPESTATTTSDIPVARVMGAAEGCIPINQIRQSVVRNDRTIDFQMSGTRWYRNTLPQSCGGLAFDRAFRYQTSLSQLCNTDIIHPISTIGGTIEDRGSCGLGMFVPVELVK